MKWTLWALVVSGCVPAHLQKYSRVNDKPKSPVKELAGDRPLDSQNKEVVGVPAASTVYAVDSQTYRFVLPKEAVWEGLLDVLMKNYNLNIVDRDSGVITTEWDSYFLNQTVYRNKVSVRLRTNGKAAVDVIIHNNVEKLDQATTMAGVWLPSEDLAGESGRIAQNVAIALNQPPPQSIESRIAAPAIETGKIVR